MGQSILRSTKQDWIWREEGTFLAIEKYDVFENEVLYVLVWYTSGTMIEGDQVNKVNQYWGGWVFFFILACFYSIKLKRF